MTTMETKAPTSRACASCGTPLYISRVHCSECTLWSESMRLWEEGEMSVIALDRIFQKTKELKRGRM